jgi:hypothetical protein
MPRLKKELPSTLVKTTIAVKMRVFSWSAFTGEVIWEIG